MLQAYYEVAIKTRLADSPDDTEMLQIIADTRTIGFAFFYQLPFNNIVSDVANSKFKELSSYIQKGMSKAQTSLDKLVEAFENMC